VGTRLHGPVRVLGGRSFSVFSGRRRKATCGDCSYNVLLSGSPAEALSSWLDAGAGGPGDYPKSDRWALQALR